MRLWLSLSLRFDTFISSVPKTHLISVLLSKISVFSCYCRSLLCSVLYTALPPRFAITGPSASKSHGRSDTSLKLAGVAYDLHERRVALDTLRGRNIMHMSKLAIGT